MRKLTDLSYGKNGANRLDVYLPDQDGYDTVIYFHGGGLTAGDKTDSSCTEIAARFTARGVAFVSVNYRLYRDGARFPEFICDCAAAAAFTARNLKAWGGNGSLFIAGQSAGAWIALMLCLDPTYLATERVATAVVKGWIIDSAQTTSHFNVLKYEKGLDPLVQRIDETAPLYHLGPQTVFSPMLLLYYDHDMPCRAEQNQLFVRAARELNPRLSIKTVRLAGGHCAGTSKKDADGEYPFLKEVFTWMEDTFGM